MSEQQTIRDIANVTVLLDDNRVTQQNFGLPLFIGPTDPGISGGAPKVRLFGSLAEVAAVTAYTSTTPEYRAAETFFSGNPRPDKMLIGYKASGESYLAAAQAINEINKNWFFLTAATRVQADIIALAGWVKTQPGGKMHIGLVNDAATLDPNSTSSTAYLLAQTDNDYSVLGYHSDATKALDLAFVARVAIPVENGVRAPGSTNAFLQPLQGITPSASLRPNGVFNTSEESALKNNRVFYTKNFVGGNRVFPEARMSGGSFFDTVYGAGWLQSRLAESLVNLQISYADTFRKLGFDVKSLAATEGAIAVVANEAVRYGFIGADYVITVPTREQTTSTDRANRVLNGLSLTANLNGAIIKFNLDAILNV